MPAGPAPSTTTFSFSRPETLRLDATGATVTLEESGEPLDAVGKVNRRHDTEPGAHGPVGCPEPDVLLSLALMAEVHPQAERTRHCFDDLIHRDRGAVCKIRGRARASRLHQRQHAIDRIVDIHEVDEVLAVTTQHDFALPGHHRAQPAG